MGDTAPLNNKSGRLVNSILGESSEFPIDLQNMNQTASRLLKRREKPKREDYSKGKSVESVKLEKNSEYLCFLAFHCYTVAEELNKIKITAFITN